MTARAWFGAVAAVLAVLYAPHAENVLHATTREWLTFGFFAATAALAHLFVAITPRNQSYHTTIAFLVPALLILPIEFVPLVAIAQHIPEWIRHRYRWYIQTFNITNYALDMLIAALVARELAGGAIADTDANHFALAALTAAALLVGLNHVILATMLRFARGHSLRETRLFTFESLSTDAVLAALGVVIAALWTTNAWLIPVALAPLVLIQRSLEVPALEEEARVDPKTGLYNSRHFTTALDEEISRARRTQRPLSLLVADLDHLREINNTHGHLTGDAVIIGIAEEFRAHLRNFDVAARFGGEEFTILMPETSLSDAVVAAERIREAIAARRFTSKDGTEVSASVSIGVASFPTDADNSYDLIQEADVALYRAKAEGRNRVVATGPGLHAIRLGA